MASKQWVIGIDLGGTKVEVALVSTDGKIHDRQRTPTDSKDGYEAVVKRMVEAVKQLLKRNKEKTPLAIGIGVAGQIDKITGMVHYAPNLGWHDVKLQDDLGKKLKLPVFACNDVRAAAWGEWKYGSGKGSKDMICIFVGTGIGSGVVSRGLMLQGHNNTAGELGHITIDMNGPVCTCGNQGCFEALAGGWAIERDAQSAVTHNKIDGKKMLALAGGDVKNVNAKIVAEAAKDGDKLAIKILDRVADALIAGTTSIVNAFGPNVLVFGGGVIEGMPELIKRIEKGVKKNALKAATDSLKILPAGLHNDSGVVGAAAFGLHNYKKTNQVI